MARLARRGLVLGMAAALVLCQGCGSHGSGGGSNSTGTGGTSVRVTGTAQFSVNVATGQVTVVPLSGGTASGRAVFDGSALGFTSSTLLDQAGSNGLRLLNVSLTNHWGVPIGELPNGTVTGLNVIFGPMTNAAAFPTDVSAQATVSTVNSSVPHAAGVAQATDGTVFASSLANHQILQVHGASVSVLAGSGTAGASDGLGTSASFHSPFGVAVNPVDGAIIVADYGNNKIRRVDRTGHVYTIAGTGVAGHADGAGGAAQLNAPQGVAVNAAGVIYVASPGDNSVRTITLTGGNAQQAASYTVATLSQSLNVPCGVTVDASGMVYVADTGNSRIVLFDSSGSSTVIAGTGTAGGTNGPGNAASFVSPEGIAWTSAGVVVSEPGLNRLRLLQLATGASATDATQWNVALLAGPGSSGASGFTDGTGTAARFSYPVALGASSGGGVYVADCVNNAVRNVALPTASLDSGATGGAGNTEPVQLSNATGVIPSAGLGTNLPYISYAGALAAGATTAAQAWNFVVPSGVTAFTFTVMVEAGTAALAAPETVSNTGGTGGGSPNVQVRTLAGLSGQSGFSNGLTSAARFDSPAGVAVDSAGDIFVADALNAALRRIGANGVVSTVAGTTSGAFADGIGTVATFNVPQAVAVTAAGTVAYVADTNNNRIRRLALTSGADPTNAANWTVNTIAGTGAAGNVSGAGNVATINAPIGICMDAGGTLYFTEYTGNRVRRLQYTGGDPTAASDWMVTFMAGDNSAAAGAAGSTPGTGSVARFSSPSGIATDIAGNVYIADNGTNLLRRMTPDGTVSTMAGSTSGYLDSSTGTSAEFSGLFGVGVDSSGYVYVTEATNNRVRRISPSGAVSTVAGAGAATEIDGAGNVATFNTPHGIAVDQGGTLYTADLNGETVRLIERVISAGSN